MTAAMLVLEPIFEADLPPEQYAYRPGRNAQQAVVKVGALLFRGHPEVVDADLADYFGSIPHAELLKSVARRIVDRRVLHLIKMWLECPVEKADDRGRKTRTTEARDETVRHRMMRPGFANCIRASSRVGCIQQAGHMTASDLYAARQIISCQAGAIHT